MPPLFLALALYAGAAACLLGTAWRAWTWARTPEPFNIPTTTGQQRSLTSIAPSRLESPATRAGAIGRLLVEGLFFRSLLRNTESALVSPTGADRPCPRIVFAERLALWLSSLAFHWSLLVIAIRHLRLFVDPVPRLVVWITRVDGFFEIGAPGWYASDLIVTIALGYLLVRRLRDPLLRYISLPVDYLAPAALMAVAVSGIVVRYLARVDLVAVRQFTLRLAALAPAAAAGSGNAWLTLHLLLVALLLAIFPFTKMVHAAGIWFSPTRNQPNDSRARRHVNPWNAPVPVHTYEAWEAEFRDKLRTARLPTEIDGG